MEYTIAQISSRLNDRAVEVCKYLLPGGKVVNGTEYRCASLGGGEGQSVAVHVSGDSTGVWCEFNGMDKGGDLLDLYRAINFCDLPEALKWAKGYLGITDEPKVRVGAKKALKKDAVKSNGCHPVQNLRYWFKERCISPETLALYKVEEVKKPWDGGPKDFAVFPYYGSSDSSKLRFIKYRSGPDKKSMHTSKDSEPCLFGWHVLDKIGRDLRGIVITEGEMDALAVYEATGIPALSIPQGASTDGSRQAWIESDWERLSQYDQITLMFDADETGQACFEKVAERLGTYRCARVDYGVYKDANEVLIHAGKERLQEIIDARFVPVPEELKDPFELCQNELEAMLENPETTQPELQGDELPWPTLSNKIRLRLGETTLWCGINGHGKSTLLNQVMVDSIVRHHRRWCIASFEYRSITLYTNIARTALGGFPRGGKPERDALENFFGECLFYVNKDTPKIEELLSSFEYAFKRYGVTHFIVDSLTKLDIAEDDYNAQKAVLHQISEFCRRLNVSVNLVCHMRKSGSETDMPGKFSIRGSSTISDEADSIFVVWRNKPKEAMEDKAPPEAPDSILKVVKQRGGNGWEGLQSLWFDRGSTQYFAYPDNHKVRGYAYERD